MSVALFILIGCVGMDGQAASRVTQATANHVEQTPKDEKKGSGKVRLASDLQFSANLTREKVEKLWGSADSAAGPSGIQYMAYLLGDGSWLWLNFERSGEPHLERALLFSGGSVRRRPVVIFDAHSYASRREISQLDFGKNLTLSDVTSVWGPVDGSRGSGIEYWDYMLADGAEAWLVFSPKLPRYLEYAAIATPEARAQLLYERRKR